MKVPRQRRIRAASLLPRVPQRPPSHWSFSPAMNIPDFLVGRFSESRCKFAVSFLSFQYSSQPSLSKLIIGHESNLIM